MASSIIFHQPDITRETSEKRIPSFRFVTRDERGGVEKDKLQKVLISNFVNRGKVWGVNNRGEPKEGEQDCLYELSEPQNGKTNLYEKKGP